MVAIEAGPRPANAHVSRGDRRIALAVGLSSHRSRPGTAPRPPRSIPPGDAREYSRVHWGAPASANPARDRAEHSPAAHVCRDRSMAAGGLASRPARSSDRARASFERSRLRSPPHATHERVGRSARSTSAKPPPEFYPALTEGTTNRCGVGRQLIRPGAPANSEPRPTARADRVDSERRPARPVRVAGLNTDDIPSFPYRPGRSSWRARRGRPILPAKMAPEADLPSPPPAPRPETGVRRRPRP